jgi:hypothetical protein
MTIGKDLIFIFTKDRPEVLKETLIHLKNLTNQLLIIDDSYYEYNQTNNRELLSLFPNAIYYGKCEFDETAKSYNIGSTKYKSVFRQLGNAEWNLGYARNYALFLTRINNADKVLFMDDDIIIPNTEIVHNSFNLLEKFDFVGANIGGMIDDSIIGRISDDMGLIDNDERAFSGGFLAFNPKKIKHPFLNIYNEDWIWLFLHSNENKYLQSECVLQNYSNPYLGFNEKILFQEYGEIVISGILVAKEKVKFELLTSKLFWESIVIERKSYLSKLYELAILSNKDEFTTMINWLLQNYSKCETYNYSELIFNYLNDKETFNVFLNFTHISTFKKCIL